MNDEVRRRLSVFFNGSQQMVDAYIQEFGANLNIRNINALRERFTKPTRHQEGTGPVVIETGQDPTFQILVDCPVCKKAGIAVYELHAKSQIIRNDPFYVPLYMGHSGYRTLNYLHCAVTVCPNCLFASPDKKDFAITAPGRKDRRDSQIPMNVIADWQQNAASHKSLHIDSGVGDALFTVPRSPAAAICSYRLADQRAEAEIRSQSRFGWFKRSNYWTRIALIERQSGRDDRPALEQARDCYAEAYRLSDWPGPEQEGQGIYILIMLYLRLGQHKEAQTYLSVMDKLSRELEKGGDQTRRQVIQKWSDKARLSWEDREDPTLFQTVQ